MTGRTRPLSTCPRSSRRDERNLLAEKAPCGFDLCLCRLPAIKPPPVAGRQRLQSRTGEAADPCGTAAPYATTPGLAPGSGGIPYSAAAATVVANPARSSLTPGPI